MVTVGVFVRAVPAELELVAQRLEELDGVLEVLALEEPGALGVVLRASDLDDAHAAVTRRLRAVEGVLVAWPLHTELV